MDDNNKKVKINEPAKIDAEITYTVNSDVKNGDISINDNAQDKLNFTQTLVQKDYINIDKLHDVYVNSGNSSQAAYDYLTNYLSENKDNPQNLEGTVSSLLNDLNKMYDSNKVHDRVAQSQSEILDKILQTNKGEEVNALICGTIHDFLAQSLEDAGLKAAIVTGGQIESSGKSDHAALIYQVKDGEYIFNNYDSRYVIKASNIKDAMKEIYKNTGSLESGGLLNIQDKDKSSYQEYPFKIEGAFGGELDKRFYNDKSIFNDDVNNTTSLIGKVVIGQNGNASVTLGGNLAYSNDKISKNTSISYQGKQTSESGLFKSSKSFGVKVEHNVSKVLNEDTRLFYSGKAIASLTKGDIGNSTETREYMTSNNATIVTNLAHEDITQKYATGNLVGKFGIEKTLVDDKNIVLSNTSQVSAHMIGTLGIADNRQSSSADGRISLESGFNIASKNDKGFYEGNISGGLLMDSTHTCDGFKPTLGAKLNVGGDISTSINQNLSFGMNANASSVFTQASTDYNASVGMGFKYQMEKNTIWGNVNGGVERQNLHVAGFNEKTEDNVTLNTTLGMQLNKKTSFYTGYTLHKDALNKTRNTSTFSVGMKINM